MTDCSRCGEFSEFELCSGCMLIVCEEMSHQDVLYESFSVSQNVSPTLTDEEMEQQRVLYESFVAQNEVKDEVKDEIKDEIVCSICEVQVGDSTICDGCRRRVRVFICLHDTPIGSIVKGIKSVLSISEMDIWESLISDTKWIYENAFHLDRLLDGITEDVGFLIDALENKLQVQIVIQSEIFDKSRARRVCMPYIINVVFDEFEGIYYLHNCMVNERYFR